MHMEISNTEDNKEEDHTSATDADAAAAAATFCCSELKTIKYKKYLQTGVPIKETKYSMNLSTLDQFLETEKAINEFQPWCKLHKSSKLKKLMEFADMYIAAHGLNEDEGQQLRDFFNTKLNNNKLTKVKEVEYDKKLAVVKAIPALSYSKSLKHFTLKNTDRKLLANFRPIASTSASTTIFPLQTEDKKI